MWCIGKYFLTSVWLFYITLYLGSCRVANEVFLPCSSPSRGSSRGRWFVRRRCLLAGWVGRVNYFFSPSSPPLCFPPSSLLGKCNFVFFFFSVECSFGEPLSLLNEGGRAKSADSSDLLCLKRVPKSPQKRKTHH